MTEEKEKKVSIPSDINIYSVNWYPRDYPEQFEAVTVRLTKVDEMGIWVELLEYSCKEGMIPLGQFTTRRTRHIPKNVKVGKTEVALISQVDEEKANMDLTRQSLKEEDIQNATSRFTDTKSLISLIAFVSEKSKIPFQDLVRQIAYPLYNEYGNAYKALQSSYQNPEIIDKLDIPEAAKAALIDQVKRMFTPQEVRIHTQFEAEVLASGGVDALREALVSGYEVAPDADLSISVIAPPMYSATLVTIGDEAGVELLYKVLSKIEANVHAVKGKFTIKQEPKAVTQKDFKAIQKELEDLKRQDEEVNMDELE